MPDLTVYQIDRIRGYLEVMELDFQNLQHHLQNLDPENILDSMISEIIDEDFNGSHSAFIDYLKKYGIEKPVIPDELKNLPEDKLLEMNKQNPFKQYIHIPFNEH